MDGAVRIDRLPPSPAAAEWAASRRGWLALRRAADLVSAPLLVVVLAPVLIAVALAVRLQSPGPVLFRQPRLGRNGSVFRIYKFRTMVVGAAGIGARYSTYAGDPRITTVGRFLRRSHLDELPQLLNILKGDMSFIGPRPTLPFQYDYYAEWEKKRLYCRPGVTGWAQVNGGNEISWDEKIEFDAWYVDNMGPALDAKISLMTITDVLLKWFGRRSTYAKSAEPTWTRGYPENALTNSLVEEARRSAETART